MEIYFTFGFRGLRRFPQVGGLTRILVWSGSGRVSVLLKARPKKPDSKPDSAKACAGVKTPSGPRPLLPGMNPGLPPENGPFAAKADADSAGVVWGLKTPASLRIEFFRS